MKLRACVTFFSLFCGVSVLAMNSRNESNIIETFHFQNLTRASCEVSPVYKAVIKDRNDINLDFDIAGFKVFGNVDSVLSRLVETEVAKSTKYLTICCGMTHQSFEKLSSFTCLEYLVLRKCFICDSDLAQIPCGVKFLDLSECMPASGRLDSLNLSHLRSNKQLKFLSLAGVRLGQKDVTELSLIGSLEYLDLSCSNFSGSAYKMMFPNTTVRIIDNRKPHDVYGGGIS